MGGQLAQHGQVVAGLLAPLGQGEVAQLRGELRRAGEVTGVEQAEAGLGVLGGHAERLVDGAYGVVEGESGVPDGVPDLLRDRADVAQPAVDQHEVEVGVGGHLQPAQAPERDEGHLARGVARRGFEQIGEPDVERRRTLLACGGAYAGSTDHGFGVGLHGGSGLHIHDQ
ncbi:hypothetical protein ACFQX7_12390 [Luedemannella flava]